MAILKNTTITDTGFLAPPIGNTASRPLLQTTIVSFTTTATVTNILGVSSTSGGASASWTAPAGVNSIELLVVAGGGGTGNFNPTNSYGGGGGGGGGLVYNATYPVTPGTPYTVTVGAGGVGYSSSGQNGIAGANGQNSVFGPITAIGGGGGGRLETSANNGGSGGGAGGHVSIAGLKTGGTATAGQGFPGGTQVTSACAGGGGGGGAGGIGTRNPIFHGGGGGPGLPFDISGTNTWYAGGGGGGAANSSYPAGRGGLGGGGNGSASSATIGTSGTAGTGGGGGGTTGGADPSNANSSSGGSGTVIIRYTQLSSDSSDPRGLIRYNTDTKSLESFQSGYDRWVGHDPLKNFAGHNLRSYSEDLSQWGSIYFCTKAYNQTLAPDGTTTADSLLESATTTGSRWIEWGASYSSGLNYTLSAFVKPNGRTFAQIFGFTDNGVFAGQTIVFNLSGAGSVASTSGTVIGTQIVALNGGWYRIAATLRSGASSTGYWKLGFQNDAAATSYAGSITNGIFVWGVQVEQAGSMGTYTKTVDAIAPTPFEIAGWRIHSYTTTGTTAFTPALSGNVEVLLVAGGGSGGTGEGNGAGDGPGGGGGGGVLYHQYYPVISDKSYTVVVGAGGAAVVQTASTPGLPGGNSQFGPLIAIGGGFGAREEDRGGSGGSGGGGGGSCISGRKPPGAGVDGQGFPGGYSNDSGCAFRSGAGGGGAGGAGRENLTAQSTEGGPGLGFNISGTWTYYAGGGGGGGGSSQAGGAAGLGGGGIGGTAVGGSVTSAVLAQTTGGSGIANTGGGGGGGGAVGPGGSNFTTSGAGGSGIVIVRYRYDN